MPCARGRRTHYVGLNGCFLSGERNVPKPRSAAARRLRSSKCPHRLLELTRERDSAIGCNTTLRSRAPANTSRRHCRNQHGDCSVAVEHSESLSLNILTASLISNLQQAHRTTHHISRLPHRLFGIHSLLVLS